GRVRTRDAEGRSAQASRRGGNRQRQALRRGSWRYSRQGALDRRGRGHGRDPLRVASADGYGGQGGPHRGWNRDGRGTSAHELRAGVIGKTTSAPAAYSDPNQG